MSTYVQTTVREFAYRTLAFAGLIAVAVVLSLLIAWRTYGSPMV